MPDKKRLQDEIRRNREAFYRRMAAENRAAAERLQRAYGARLDAIERAIRVYEGTPADRAFQAMLNLQEKLVRELDSLRGAIADVGAAMERAGSEAGYRAGVAALRRGGMGVMFNVPTLESIQAAIGYVDSAAWQSAVNSYARYHGQHAADMVLDAFTRGVNPRQTAVWLRRYFVDGKMPMLDALRLTRTTQLYSARQGTRQIYERTGVREWVWSANIGNPRTCLSCIVLHGKRFPVSQVLNDHHLGRCAMTPVTPRWEELGFSDGGEPVFETGIDWLKRQPMDVQQQVMGPEYWKAWQQGLYRLEDVPRTYHNPIFGDMRRRATLTELTGASSAPEA